MVPRRGTEPKPLFVEGNRLPWRAVCYNGLLRTRKGEAASCSAQRPLYAAAMSLPSTFSRRKRQASPASDVYHYDVMPYRLRVQFIQILNEAFGPWHYENDAGQQLWTIIVKALRKEIAVFQLGRGSNPAEEFSSWFLAATEVDDLLDAVEFSCRAVDKFVRKDRHHFGVDADAVLAEVNARFQEAQVGYQYQSGEVIRIDSMLLHKEAVIPALRLLSQPDYAGPNSEFLEAHRQYRAADYEQCLTECCKAFESVLKVVAAKEKWPVNETDPASKLLQAAFANGLIPAYLQSEFDGLRAVLQSGVPTVRNKSSGHGTGVTPRVVPRHLAAFQLHQTAAAILFIVEAHEAKP